MSFTEEDKINRKIFVDKIASFVEALQKDKHISIALDGAWGSGKSYILGMLNENLIKHTEYLIVNYNAWENNFYSDPLIAILYCVLDDLKKYIGNLPEAREKIKRGVLTTLKTFGKETLTTMKNSGGKVALFARVIECISNVITSSGKLVENEKLDEYTSYKTLIEEVKNQLNSITEFEQEESSQTKIIILVDEIDRCLPDEQLTILERLHHLFEVKNCAVIVAINQSSVAQTVKTLYGIKGREYLRKFFDFTFKVEICAKDYLWSLLKDFAKKFNSIQSNDEEYNLAIRVAYECLLYGSANVLDKVDNRDISHYYELLENIGNNFGWEKIEAKYVFFIIIALFIRKFVSNSFLNEEIIIDNQNDMQAWLEQNYEKYYSQGIMPYYDYLNKFIGINRQSLPDKIKYMYRYSNSGIPEYSWFFNEIVLFSLNDNVDIKNIMFRPYSNNSDVDRKTCITLAQLVKWFSGEQERDE